MNDFDASTFHADYFQNEHHTTDRVYNGANVNNFKNISQSNFREWSLLWIGIRACIRIIFGPMIDEASFLQCL